MSPHTRPQLFELASGYALGALSYHLLCGRPPYSGDNAIAIGFAHLSETPMPPSQLRKDIPPSLDAAGLAALAKNPDDRPASARAFLEMAFAAKPKPVE